MPPGVTRARPVIRRCRNLPRAPWPGRYGWRASDADILLAQHAQWELAGWRQHVILVPADPAHPRTRQGQKVRVRQDDGAPRWYLELFYRRPQHYRPSIRKYVRAALAHLCATRYIRPDQNRRQPSMDREVLTVLYDFCDPRDWGYDDWGGGLRLRRHRFAEHRRHTRRAREGRR